MILAMFNKRVGNMITCKGSHFDFPYIDSNFYKDIIHNEIKF